jgi:hypothetical protein
MRKRLVTSLALATCLATAGPADLANADVVGDETGYVKVGTNGEKVDYCAIGASTTGNASHCVVGVSGTGDATADAMAVSGTGDAEASCVVGSSEQCLVGGIAISGTGHATGPTELAIDGPGLLELPDPSTLPDQESIAPVDDDGAVQVQSPAAAAVIPNIGVTAVPRDPETAIPFILGGGRLSPSLCEGASDDPHKSTTSGYEGRINFHARSNCKVIVPRMKTTAQLWQHRWWGWQRFGAKGVIDEANRKSQDTYSNGECRNNTFRGTGYHEVMDTDQRTYKASTESHHQKFRCEG